MKKNNKLYIGFIYDIAKNTYLSYTLEYPISETLVFPRMIQIKSHCGLSIQCNY